MERVPDQIVIAILKAKGSDQIVAQRYRLSRGHVNRIRKGQTRSGVAPHIPRRAPLKGWGRLGEAKVIAILKDVRIDRVVAEEQGISPCSVQQIRSGLRYATIAPEIARTRRSRGRPPNGGDVIPPGRTDLTEEQIVAIIKDKRPHKIVAPEYGLNWWYVRLIRVGSYYKWVQPKVKRWRLQPFRRLNTKQVVAILLDHDGSYSQIAKRHGVSETALNKIKRGHTHRSVRPDIPRGSRRELKALRVKKQ
jgi:uncharacterized protein YerC